jgi:hypothetical protein
MRTHGQWPNWAISRIRLAQMVFHAHWGDQVPSCPGLSSTENSAFAVPLSGPRTLTTSSTFRVEIQRLERICRVKSTKAP